MSCHVFHADLRGCCTRTPGLIFSPQWSRRSSAGQTAVDSRGLPSGWLLIEGALERAEPSSVCLECQRSGALDVWSALAAVCQEFRGRLGLR